jgi:uroporphyrinogen-III decarboxylase
MDSALAGQAPQAPVYAQMHDFAAHQMRIPGRIFYTQPDIMVPAILEVAQRFGFEIASITYDVYNIEAEGLGQKLLYSESDAPDIDRSQPLIRQQADLALITTPDFETAGRFRNVIEMHRIYQQLTGLPPTLSFCAPFSLAANIFGIEPLLMAIYTDPGFASELFQRITELVLAPWIAYQQAKFPDARSVTGADAVASIPIVNTSILEQWVAPPILRLRQLCGPAVHVSNWVGERYLKKPEDMLKLKLAVSPGAIQGQDPDVETLGADFYKRFATQNDVSLTLGIGASFLAQSAPEEVAQRVQQYIETGNAGGRFALYLCNLAANTPPENVRAALDAARRFGEV